MAKFIGNDEALYCKQLELMWANPEYQELLIPRLGGLQTPLYDLHEGHGLASTGDRTTHKITAVMEQIFRESYL